MRAASEYNISYKGRDQVDEISCYLFTVSPKELTKDRKRYFDGDIWVDDQDLQIVKTFGRATGYLSTNEDQQFPKFETYREQIDGKYWFPTYTYADDTLNFKNGAFRMKQSRPSNTTTTRSGTSTANPSITYGKAEKRSCQPAAYEPKELIRMIRAVFASALFLARIVAAAELATSRHVRNFGRSAQPSFVAASPPTKPSATCKALGVGMVIDLLQAAATARGK